MVFNLYKGHCFSISLYKSMLWDISWSFTYCRTSASLCFCTKACSEACRGPSLILTHALDTIVPKHALRRVMAFMFTLTSVSLY